MDKGNFSIDYKISVHPVEEKNSMGEEMVRRARANWAICSCCGKVNDLTVRVHRKALQREVRSTSSPVLPHALRTGVYMGTWGPTKGLEGFPLECLGSREVTNHVTRLYIV